MIYKIADFYFDVENISSETERLCREYLYTEQVTDAAKIVITNTDVEREMAQAEAYRHTPALRAECEGLALYRKICAHALANDAFLMHCAVIEYEGRGYAFLASSGTGKTTHVRQWKKAFGAENVTIVNGDKPILRFLDGAVYAYGTPWNGKEHYGTNGCVPLAGICFIKRGKENTIRPVSAEEAVPLLFSQIMITDSSDLARQLELADQLITQVPMYLLQCNISEEAATVAYAGMNRGKA